jgi:tRNA (guanine37-N1)-methyltransferase
MDIAVLTLFPDFMRHFFAESVVGRAVERGIVKPEVVDFRNFTDGRHREADDRPFGGGPGMLLKPEPIVRAVEYVESSEAGSERGRYHRVMLTPGGRRLSPAVARELAGHDRLMVICGHYEGFDDRIRVLLEPDEVSLGDYVIMGGEAAAMVLIEAALRFVPGLLGCSGSAPGDSFGTGEPGGEPLLEGPQYTRPAHYRGLEVPEVLRSGDHQKVAAWCRLQALERTRERRPDLLISDEPGDTGGRE